MQRQAPTPSHHCFLQAPTYRRLYPQFFKLQLARKHQLPSIFCRHQPTGGSNLGQLQLTAIKQQLDREAPTSSIYQTESLLIYLRYQPYSVASPSVLIFLIFSAFYILHSLYICSLACSKKKTLSAYPDDIIYRFPHMTVCILLGIQNGKSCLFAFCLLTPFISLLRNYNCRCQF